MRIFSLVLITLLTFSSSYATISERMWCEVGEGSCIGDSCYQDISVSPTELRFTFQPMFHEIRMFPTVVQAIRGFDRYELNETSFKASWDGGEHWLSMTSSNGYQYEGTLTLEQDFEMEIVCEKQTVFLE